MRGAVSAEGSAAMVARPIDEWRIVVKCARIVWRGDVVTKS
jgi:hypothetical protein